MIQLQRLRVGMQQYDTGEDWSPEHVIGVPTFKSRVIKVLAAARGNTRVITFSVLFAIFLEEFSISTMDPVTPHILQWIHGLSNYSVPASPYTRDNSPNLDSLNWRSEPSSEFILLTTLRSLAMALFAFPAGYIVQRFGSRFPLCAGCFANAVISIGIAYSRYVGVILMWKFLQGLTYTLIIIAALSLLAESFPADRLRMPATAFCLSGQNLAIIAGYAFGSYGYKHVCREFPFWVLSFVYLVFSAYYLVMIDKKKQSVDEQHSISMESYSRLAGDSYMHVALVGPFLFNVSFGLYKVTVPHWLSVHLGSSSSDIALIFSASLLTSFVVQNLIGCMFTNSKWTIISASLLCTGTATMTFPFWLVNWHALPSNVLFGVGRGLWSAALIPSLFFILDIRHFSEYAAALSVVYCSGAVGDIVGKLVAIFFVDQVLVTWLFIAGGGVFFIAFPTFSLWRKLPSNEHEGAPTNGKESSFFPAIFQGEDDGPGTGSSGRVHHQAMLTVFRS